MAPLSPLFHLLPLLALLTALPSSASHGHPNRRAHERAREAYNHQNRDARPADDSAPAIVERTQHYDNRTIVERDHHFDNRTLVERASYTGVGTYYYTGLGACGLYSKDNDYMVALNSAQYGSGYPGPQCFKYITIQVGSKQIDNIEILDECPTCDYGSLDLSPGLFTQFADQDAGTIHLTWWYAGDGGAATTSTSTTPTSTYTPPTSTYVAPSSTSTSEWVQPSTSTSSSSWSSEWVQPSTASSTAASSSEQWSQPAQTSTSTAPSSTESSTAASSTITSSATFSSAVALNTTNPFATLSSASPSANTTVSASISASISASVSASVGGSGDVSVSSEVSGEGAAGNLEAINALAAQYGQLVVAAASVQA